MDNYKKCKAIMESLDPEDPLWFAKIGVIESHLNCNNFTATKEAVDVACIHLTPNEICELDETDIYIHDKIILESFSNQRVRSQGNPLLKSEAVKPEGSGIRGYPETGDNTSKDW